MTCDFWECQHREHCKLMYATGFGFPPCGSCRSFDVCEVCKNYIECADLVRTYMPQMFRRIVREIRTGEDLSKVQAYVCKNTLGGKKSI